MKVRSRKLLALMLAASMSLSGGVSALAEDTATETQTQQAETQAPETQPQTQAPETQPETQPQTQPETQPQTQPQTQAPETQPETQPQTQPETQPQTQSEIQSETQSETKATESETQTETEKTTGTFTAAGSGLKATVTLPGGQKIASSAVLKVSGSEAEGDSLAKIRKALEKAQRTVSGAKVISLSFSDKDGNALTLPKGTKVEVSFSEAFDLKFEDFTDSETAFLTLGKSASKTDGSIQTSEDGKKITGLAFTVGSDSSSLTVAAAGVQDHVGQGGEIALSDFEGHIGDAASYAAIADDYDGPDSDYVRTTAKDREAQKKKKTVEVTASDLLGSLEAESAFFAEAESSDTVTVISLFADEQGSVSLDKVNGGALDVTDTGYVINIVAPSETADVTVPSFSVSADMGKLGIDEAKALASRVIINLTAGNGKDGAEYGYVTYRGHASAGGSVTGTILAPAAQLSIDGDVTGEACAKKLSIGGSLTGYTVSGGGHKEEKKTDKKTSEKSAETETEQETASPAPSESELVVTDETETETEALSEVTTEAPSSETIPETESEIIAPANEEETAFSGTIGLEVMEKLDIDEDSYPMEDAVTFHLYRQDEGSDEADLGTVTAEGMADIPSEAAESLKAGSKLRIHPDALPVKTYTGDEGETTVYYLPLGDLTVTLGEDGLLQAEETAGWLVSYKENEAGGYAYTFTCTYEGVTQKSAQAVTIGVIDRSQGTDAYTYLAGSEITIANTADDSQSAVIDSMPDGLVYFDFSDLLGQIEDPQEGDTAEFSVTETAPFGYQTYMEEPVSVLTFAYVLTDGTGAWALTKRTAANAGTDAPEITEGDDLTSLLFEDVPSGRTVLAKVTASQISYLDSKSVGAAAGATVKLSFSGKTLVPGTDYLLYQAKADGTAGGSIAVSSSGTYTVSSESVYVQLQYTDNTADLFDDDQAKTLTAELSYASGAGFHTVAAKGSVTLKKSMVDQEAKDAAVIALTARKNAPVLHVDAFVKDSTTHVSNVSAYLVSGSYSRSFTIGSKPVGLSMSDSIITTLVKNGKGSISGSAENYLIDSSKTIFTVTEKNGTVTFSPDTVYLYATPATINGTVTVGGQFFLQNGSDLNNADKLYTASGTTKKIYVRLYEDEAHTKPVSGVKSITVQANNYSSSSKYNATFTVPVDEAAGKSVYYVGQVTEKGEALKDANILVRYLYGSSLTQNGAVTLTVTTSKKADGTTEKSVTNQYITVRDYYKTATAEFTNSGSFGILVKVVDSDGNPVNVDDMVATFTVSRKIADNKYLTLKNRKVKIQNTSQGSLLNISFPLGQNTEDKITVKMLNITTSAGASLTKDYTLQTASADNGFSASGTENGSRVFTLKAGQKNQGPVVFVLKKNKVLTDAKAKLTLTKAVQYHKTPVRVNATYYLGIFSDPQYKNLLFKKTMVMTNASSVSDTLTVNLNNKTVKDQTITLYFAETNANGQAVAGGKKTGYDISYSTTSVTLSPDNLEATVVVTNEILDGTSQANAVKRAIANGNAAADVGGISSNATLASDVGLTAESNASSTKTGDSTPLMPLVMALLGSGIAAVLLLIFILRRRKRAGK